MSCQPAEQPLHRAETRKVTSTTEGEPEERISGQEKEGHNPTVEGKLPEKIQEAPISHEVLVRGTQGGNQTGHGEDDQEEQGQEIERKRKANFYPKNSPNLEINYKHYPITVLFDKNVAKDDFDDIEHF